MPVSISRAIGALLNNKGLKLVSLVLAIISWYAIVKITSVERWLKNVPVHIQVQEGWAILDRSVTAADVLFRGSQEDIVKLEAAHTTIEVDIREEPLTPEVRVQLTPRQVKSLGGARPVEVVPNELVLQLDQEGEKQVPVKVDFSSDPPSGFELEKVVCTPASVALSGPRQRLKEIAAVHTTPIDLKGHVRSFQLRLSVEPPSDRWVARIEPETVTVEITLAEHAAEKTLEGVRVGALISPDLAPRVRVWPGKVKVLVRGRSEVVESLQRDDVRAYVDCSGLDPRTSYELPVQVVVPEGLSVGAVEPATVSVAMEKL